MSLGTTEQASARERLPSWAAPVLVTLVALGLFANTLGHGFVGDDAYLIRDNPLLEAKTPWSRVFFGHWGAATKERSFAKKMNAGYYRPLATAALRLQRGLFDRAPRGYHVVSVLLHALCCLLVFYLASLYLRRPGALFAALLFAAHAVHTEAVNAAFYQTTLLAALFALAALLLNGRGPRGQAPPLGRDALVALAALAALLSKENAIVLPGLLALQDRLLVGRPWRRWRSPLYLVLAALTAAYLLVRSQALAGSGLSYFGDAGIATRLWTMLEVWWLYLRLLLWPHPLCPFYEWSILPPLTSPSLASLGGALALLLCVALVVGLALRHRRRHRRGETPSGPRLLEFALLFYPLCLLPVMQLVPILNVAAERFLYLASLAFVLTAGLAMDKLWALGKRPRQAAVAAALLFVALQATITVVRNPAWSSDEALSRATLRSHPRALTARLILIRTLRAQGRHEEARRILAAGLRLAPRFSPFLQLERALTTGPPHSTP